MKAAPRLEMRQSQSLVMTQQLQQSIKLLQLSSLELSEFIELEMEKNPLLSTDEASDTPAETKDAEEDGSEGEDSSEEKVEALTDVLDGERMGGSDEPRDAESNGEEWSEDSDHAVLEDRSLMESTLHYTGAQYHTDDDDGGAQERTVRNEISLREHLQAQLMVELVAPVDRMIGMHLIDLLDEGGYVSGNLTEMAERLSCELALVETTLVRMQQFDPVGVFACNLAECLALQLKEKDRLDPAMAKLLEHLDLLAKNDFTLLQKLCGVDEDDLREMIAEIKCLNPKPAQGFAHDVVQTVIPDVFLRRMKGGWQVELNTNVLPRVLVNRRYYAHLASHSRDRNERKYLTEQLATANWLIKALDQRAQTILKVTTEIVNRQEEFFEHGIRYLKPLTLREVAESVGLHESTVSRVTSNKYMASPRGTFELKYFFTSSIQNTTGGEDYSSRSVQHMIKEMIDGEEVAAILSDDTIAEHLKSRGVDVARRTVAKYREGMQIGSSVERRRLKAGQRK